MQGLTTTIIIDDNPISNLICKKIMEKEGFASHIHSFLRSIDALAHLQNLANEQQPNFPDVIFVDINMPEMDGWEFLEEYLKISQEVTHKCKLFIMSSSIAKSDIDRAKSYDVVKDYILKPLKSETLQNIQEKYFID